MIIVKHGFAMGRSAWALMAACAPCKRQSVSSVSAVYGTMEAGSTSARSATVIYARMISSSTRHRAKSWKLNLTNVRTLPFKFLRNCYVVLDEIERVLCVAQVNRATGMVSIRVCVARLVTAKITCGVKDSSTREVRQFLVPNAISILRKPKTSACQVSLFFFQNLLIELILL